MNYITLEENAARFVARVYKSPNQVEYPYHNLSHTKSVVGHAKEIAAFYSLNEMDLCLISIAAWFHDVGQLTGDPEGHEERSVLVLSNYLKTTGAEPRFMMLASNCILSTKYGSHPAGLPEMILCDADTFNFGTALFRETDPLVKKEMEMRSGTKKLQWNEESLLLLKNHVYYTEYCQLLLQQGKQENIAWLESLINKE